mgnify:CR=1 FL=1
MEAIFTSILNLINREMPELSLVDEDYGQLETAMDVLLLITANRNQ